ncbi:MAG TPA: hypothetical protein VHI54_10400, partial [Actinomycetota bacterium]|nr:hypothetical protein [Actinomycetota bacterium]
SLRNLRAVQNRRQFPTRVVQAFQVRILRGLYPQKHSPSSRGGHSKAESEPLFFRIARKVPVFRHLAGRFIGIGPRPEHVGAVSPARAAR